nr:hypothetical protein [uncultured Thiodictyon sp.]
MVLGTAVYCRIQSRPTGLGIGAQQAQFAARIGAGRQCLVVVPLEDRAILGQDKAAERLLHNLMLG